MALLKKSERRRELRTEENDDMTTYEEYLRLLARLSPAVQRIVEQLFNNGRTLNPQELLRLLYFLFGAANAEEIRRILVLLARLGRLNPAVLAEAIGLHAAGEGASITGSAVAGSAGASGGASTGAGGAGAAAGAGLAATIAAILAALLAIALAAYTISTEVLTELSFPGSGLKCKASHDDTTIWKIWRRGIGSRTAVQKAIDAAQEHCERIGKCEGGCDNGECKPVASFIRIDDLYRVFWTTAEAYYICSCQCVFDEEPEHSGE